MGAFHPLGPALGLLSKNSGLSPGAVVIDLLSHAHAPRDPARLEPEAGRRRESHPSPHFPPAHLCEALLAMATPRLSPSHRRGRADSPFPVQTASS